MEAPLLLLQESLCVECDACSVACSLTKTGAANAKIGRVQSIKRWPDDPAISVCRHWRCEGKECIQACPTEAIEIENGILVIDPGLCNGCSECVPACPYRAIFVEETEWKAWACDLCSGAPACVPACPTDALLFEGDGHVN